MTKISIIGLGWIGQPLAHLLQNNGHAVVGSTTSVEKQTKLVNQGLEAFQFELIPFPQGKGFQELFTSEVLVINIPPRSRTTNGEMYLEQLKFLRSMVDQSKIQKVIFVSSTGVYPDQNQEEAYTEAEQITPKTTGNITLLKGETSFMGCKELTIVRFGGLLGDDRIPGKYVAGREDVNGNTRVNFIYRNDAARMLSWIIENELWNEIYNGVAPIHSLRKDIYERNVVELGLEAPKSYSNPPEGFDRLVSGEKILKSGFTFDYPNPLNFPYSKEV
ncbi:NAD-dependent epimerase/dehydratase family protein [Algoriphagus antarcticus]|uniref:Nucleoside-diphosphate-sugar epimerase n=1 Tax=Algoriphagus antarcticus TaxID=238540 RepID=A0A3E0D4W3_9BACT|nr:NAD-dependent epimerase/dehydratase family protein [Algoriphagus antarcticus]REG77567.1 nucleoside-diphosphate-sugar epimerase [Algoriphagus antarcticus]